jgi:hypothetical protein
MCAVAAGVMADNDADIDKSNFGIYYVALILLSLHVRQGWVLKGVKLLDKEGSFGYIFLRN